MNTVAIIAAHPDDEVMGCAGTIALHSNAGDQVHILFMTDGISARGAEHRHLADQRRDSARRAAQVLGVQQVQFLDFPDNAMDSIPLLDINRAIEAFLAPLQPDTVYTHFGGDLNIDHRRTYQSVLTCCRPQPQCSVKRIYCFETQSSTEWRASTEPAFVPNLFRDISGVATQVDKALQCYADELRNWPHSRSREAMLHRQQWRGSCVGVPLAEAFWIEREIR